MDGKGVGAVAVLCFLGLIAGAIGFLPAYEHNVAVQEGEPTTGTVLSTDVDVRTDDEGEEALADAAIPVEDVDGPVLPVSGGDDRLWNTVAPIGLRPSGWRATSTTTSTWCTTTPATGS